MDILATGERAARDETGEPRAAADLAAAIGHAHRALRRRVRATMPACPLPQSQVAVLQVLRQRPGLPVGELAVALNLAQNTASTLVQQLVRQGLVQRCADARDRRVAHLALTPAATVRLDHWRDARAVAVAQALDSLSVSQSRALSAAVPALSALATALEDATV